MNDDLGDYYETVLTPNNAPNDSKTGVTFKGKDAEYLKAHRIMMEMAKSRGDRYIINETEFNVIDAPKNKPACIEIKHKNGQSGKANLKIYPINGRGGATIHITKISRGYFEHVKILAFKVVKFLLDNIISGRLERDGLEKMRNNSVVKTDRKISVKKAKVSTGEMGHEKFGSLEKMNKHTRKRK